MVTFILVICVVSLSTVIWILGPIFLSALHVTRLINLPTIRIKMEYAVLVLLISRHSMSGVLIATFLSAPLVIVNRLSRVIFAQRESLETSHSWIHVILALLGAIPVSLDYLIAPCVPQDLSRIQTELLIVMNVHLESSVIFQGHLNVISALLESLPTWLDPQLLEIAEIAILKLSVIS